MTPFFRNKIEIIKTKCTKCGKEYEAVKGEEFMKVHFCKECYLKIRIAHEQEREKAVKTKLKK